MISNPRASHPARRSGRLSDPQGSRLVTAYAAADLARLAAAPTIPSGAATRATTCGPAVKVGRAAFF